LTAVFRVEAPCSKVEVHQRFIALMIKAARTSETLVNFNQTTRRYNPEDSHLRTHRRENLKSYLFPFIHTGELRSSLLYNVLHFRQ
jgi:hypothetical protein